MLRNTLLQQYWNPKHQMVFMKSAAAMPRCTTESEFGESADARCTFFRTPDNQHNHVLGASCNAKAGSSDTEIS
jgi:hypothetical protein